MDAVIAEERRRGALVEQDAGPAAAAGWSGGRYGRGTAGESLVVYTDVDAPEAMAFTPENLNRLREVSGLTGDAIPETGLAGGAAYLPLIGSTSLAAAGPYASMDVAGGQVTGARSGEFTADATLSARATSRSSTRPTPICSNTMTSRASRRA